MNSMRWTHSALALAALLSTGACAQVLGIEDARVDSALVGGADGLGGNAGTASSGSGPASNGGETSGGSATGGSTAGPHGGGSDSSAGSMSAAGAPSMPSRCESYCDAVTSNCKGQYEQYLNFDQCIEVCKRLPPGSAGDENVNSVECRIRQAEFAQSEPFVYCKSAGPLGEGRCGSDCISYCSLMQATCTPASTAGNLEPSYFADSAACLAACTGLPEDPAGPVQYSSSATVSPSCFVGNNVFCRTYHVAAALKDDAPTEHCPHAMGGDPCNQP